MPRITNAIRRTLQLEGMLELANRRTRILRAALMNEWFRFSLDLVNYPDRATPAACEHRERLAALLTKDNELDLLQEKIRRGEVTPE